MESRFIKNKQLSARFLYDSGIRLNLVPDFLLNCLVNDGELGQNYNQKYGLLLLYRQNINQFT
jgi:hypothetical protein